MKYSKKLYRSLYIYIYLLVFLYLLLIILVTARQNMTIEFVVYHEIRFVSFFLKGRRLKTSYKVVS